MIFCNICYGGTHSHPLNITIPNFKLSFSEKRHDNKSLTKYILRIIYGVHAVYIQKDIFQTLCMISVSSKECLFLLYIFFYVVRLYYQIILRKYKIGNFC